MTDDDEERLADRLARWAEGEGAEEAPTDLQPGVEVIRGLGEVLGPPGVGARPGADSVLSLLKPELRPPSRPVLLPEEQDPAAPLLIPHQGAEGRYTIAGEIARGGMGIILRGQDVDLGRDVAIKVLREDLADEPDHVHRFVEEAQIGGQLQHPGIVPVYELGVGQDRRPFFAMKLIKGRTLAALLQERTDASHDLQRFLGIFEAVCQTMAYAHARGVIHRDLKPSNVMVGSFGEVLVVDWGMGKVLRRGGVADERRTRPDPPPGSTMVRTVRSAGGGTPSEVGAVMGTPPYMSPEQARGAVEDLDEQTDVFALGGILCEILTGRPPYEGSTLDMLRSAAAGGTAPARRSLEGCGADPALVALASSCLEAEPGKRPRGAAALATAISEYRASLDRRRREAEADADRSRVRAQEEVKRRRLTVALAAMALALLLGAGGAWRWYETEQREREAQALARLGEATAEAERRLAAARVAASDADLWRGAVVAAREAAAIGRSEDVPERSRQATLAALSAVESEASAAAAASARREGERRLVARLDEVRQARGEHFDLARQDADYRDAFSGAGLVVQTLEGVAATRDRLVASADRADLVLALGEWRRIQRALGKRTELLDALLDAVDEDPWRRRLRTATTLQGLRDLAQEVDPDRAPVESLVALVGALGNAGDAAAAAALGRKVRERHPDDFWANWAAGEWTTRAEPKQWEEASRAYAAAVALRPQGYAARVNLGSALRARGDLSGAAFQYREAIRLKRDLPEAHYNLALVLRAQGDAEASVASARRAIRLKPDYGEAHGELGLALLDLGDVAGAVAASRESARLRPDLVQAQDNLGVVLRRAGDLPGAIAAHRAALAIRTDLPEVYGNLAAALRDAKELEAAVAAYREGLRLHPEHAETWVGLGGALRDQGDLPGAEAAWRRAGGLAPRLATVPHHLGMVAAERGDFAAAVALWRQALELRPGFTDVAQNLAVVERALGDPKLAVTLLRESARRYPSDALVHAGLGRALRQGGELEAAAAALREALRLDPSLTPARDLLVETLRQAGRPEEAQEAAAGGR